jgi:hypothetical protein
MSNPSGRIEDQLPYNYREDYPNFIILLKKYYDWMYGSNLGADEISALRSDTSWISTDIQKYIETQQSRYIGRSIDDAIIELNNVPSPGTASDLLSNNISLNISPDNFVDKNGVQFLDSSSSQLSTPGINKDILKRKFENMGYFPVDTNEFLLLPVDQVLMISLLKHIYAIKGTFQSIKLFFNLFFNENIEIYYPKLNIAVIDDNFVLDGVDVLRDDRYYDEYSYVIKTQNAPEHYTELFNSIYLKLVHPTGFNVFIRHV